LIPQVFLYILLNMELSLKVDHLLSESESMNNQGELAKALQAATQALDLARSADPSTTARALVGLARVRFRLGQYSQGKTLAIEALSLVKEKLSAETVRVQADIYQILGNCAAETNSFVEAEEHYRQASELARESGYVRGRVAAIHGLANNVYFPRGKFELALSFEEEAYGLLREHSLDEDLIFPFMSLAMICLTIGQVQRAGIVLGELSRIAAPHSFAQGYCVCLKADLALKEDDLQQAEELYARAQKISELTGEPWLNINFRLGMSRYQQRSRNSAAARDWANEALTYAKRLGYLHEEGKALVERARACWGGDDLLAAETDLAAAIDIFEKLDAAFDLARARFLLAGLLTVEQKTSAAAAWRRAAKALLDGNYAFYIDQERALAYPMIAAHLNDPDPEIAHLSAVLLEHFKAVPPAPLRVVIFGPFKVYQGRRLIPVSDWKRRRAGELLRLLLANPGHSLHRDQICEALWPDRPANSALTYFHQATSALRQILEPELPEKFPSRYVQVEESHVTLNLPPGSEVDFENFEDHVRKKEWEAALALFTGEPFASDRYQNWAAWRREKLIEQYFQALMEMAEKHFSASESKAALENCQLILAEDPWNEPAGLLAMRACIQMNDRLEAIRIYLKLAAALRDDLGILPSPELRLFYQSLIK
jgi:DNA-binding SARP family transcriptional activator